MEVYSIGILLIFTVIQTCTSYPLKQFYPFGAAAGDSNLLAKDDESTSSRILVSVPFPFFGSLQSAVYINKNGAITFEAARLQTSHAFPSSEFQKIIAPFWTQINTTDGGYLWYRTSMDNTILRRGTNEIRSFSSGMFQFSATLIVVVTWENVAAHLCSLNWTITCQQRNTFQLVLITDGIYSFALFNYNKITWTQNTQVGFDAGDGENYFSVPGSMTDRMRNLPKMSNIDIPGQFVFRVDQTETDQEKRHFLYKRSAAVPVRLVDGTLSSGRVEIQHNNIWGTICDDHFTSQTAGVLCHMLGFSRTGASYTGSAVFGQGSGEIWLDDVICTGSEESIMQCQSNGWGVHNCGHSEDVGITCTSALPIRLMAGTFSSGRVEIQFKNRWGTICDDAFTSETAGVLCHMLGFSRTGATYIGAAGFGQGSGPIWLDNLICTGSEASIMQCRSNGWGVHNCGHHEDVGIYCPSPLPIRLMGGTLSSGRVEIQYNNIWGTICDDAFTSQTAGVLCHMLGFSRTGASYTGSAAFGQGSGEIWLDDVICTGFEASIMQCRSNGWGVHNCGHGEDVGITCSSVLPIRLVNGTLSSGRVEIQFNNIWGTICDDGFTSLTAGVLCHTLGFSRTGASYTGSAAFGQGYGDIWLDDVICTGSEESIMQCRSNGWGVHNCGHGEDVGITCSSVFPIRLVNGTLSSGRVEIQFNNIWGTICDDGFTSLTAGVLCHTLGFSRTGASYTGSTAFGQGSGKIWLDDVICTGSEASIMQCRSNGWGVHNCGHGEDVGITCSSALPIRLVNGTLSSGRVEIQFNNTWGTICDDGFTSQTAEVICHMLGFRRNGASYAGSATFGQGSGQIWLDEVICTGSESSIMQCRAHNWGVHNCGHHEDVGVYCSSAIPLRLVDGTLSSGRVEIQFNNTWGTICDDGFTSQTASVICHMLGFSRNGASYAESATFGQGSGQIWLDEVICTGSESSIMQCRSNGWGVHDCGHHEDVGVYCSSAIPLRLVDGTLSSGRVEIQFNNTWGTICDDGFTSQTAGVICHMLGFSRNGASYAGSAAFGQGSGKIWLDDLICTGSESSIMQCQSNGWGVHNCGHSEDVGITCFSDACASYPCSHGTCTNQDNGYICNCLSGYTGRLCDTDINECQSSPCLHGTCSDGINRYLCHCFDGYTGTNCETDEDECASSPCVHGECWDLVNGYTCSCNSGYTGRVCDSDINECQSSPCLHGICSDGINQYSCHCFDGYMGINCETEIDECASSPCVHGECLDLVNGFTCRCNSGYTGRLCDTDIDDCSSSPCMHGVCLDEVNGYTCSCLSGYTGRICDIDINECENSPCFHGRCFDGINQYSCHCFDGYMGTNCETDIDDCQSSPCFRGNCFDGINQYSCHCFDGYTGSNCETDIDECAGSPCVHGSCLDEVNGYSCSCISGYTGRICDSDIDDCQSSPCLHGNCSDGINQYSCHCFDGYTGANCETEIDECASSPCVHGDCLDEVNGYTCTCISGYTGRTCNTDIDNCQSSPCLHGNCSDGINQYSCQCFDGYTGANCETDINECAGSPCAHGDCLDEVNGYTCTCISGYTGRTCDTDIDDCQSSPCLHGNCSDGIDQYSCHCFDGYTGTNCETDIDDCQSSPCLHGNCSDGINQYTCNCFDGYTGTNCETDINECAGSPCVHGDCLDEVNGYTCSCNSGYTGRTCDTDIDDCQSSPCLHGNCSDGINQYSCHCFDGYTGTNCETDINECAGSPCVHGDCLDEVNGYTCSCNSGYTGRTCDTDIDDCQSSPCLHGNCSDGIDQYSCHCFDGYTGTNCETDINECAGSPCVHGHCLDKVNGYTCTCISGYTGRTCNTDIDDCQSSPCLHGNCSDGINQYSCHCFDGYTGTNCETEIDECAGSPCVHGDCLDEVNGYTCTCISGYTGRTCNTDINDCQSSPCLHGNCSDGINQYSCQCFDGYTGTNCETDKDECDSSPCVHGECLDLVNGYTCSCNSGYTGRICDTDIDDCQNSPCLHGNCSDGINQYSCHCFDGYTGTDCETDIDDCQSSPCLHGNCSDGINQYSCHCFDGYTGTKCETEICHELPRVVNCPNEVQEITFSETTKNITLSSVKYLPNIYGQSCNGTNLTIFFPEVEIKWSRKIQTFEITVNDTLGQSAPCLLRLKTTDKMPPIFENCPTSDIEQYGTNKGAAVFWSPIIVHDNAGNITLTENKLPGQMFPLGTYTVQYNATDEFGNANMCYFNVTVKKLPTEECKSPPQVLHGTLFCNDLVPLQCFIKNCENGFLQTTNKSFVCEDGLWKPTIPEEFATSSCIKPEPILLERNYTFVFTCPNIKFNPVDLKDCFNQSGLCSRGDISLCDNPFQRVYDNISSTDTHILATLKGTLPFAHDRNHLEKAMDNYEKLLEEFLTSTNFTNFTNACYQLLCEFENIQTDAIKQTCGEGTVEEIVNGQATCRKCGPGWFYENGECILCEIGFYQDQEGQSDCKRCPDGTSSQLGTRLLSKCDIVVTENQSSFSSTTLTLIGISVCGIFLILVLTVVMLVKKCRGSPNKHIFENPMFDDSYPEVKGQIMMEDRC
ncbi:uncharacterized protein LOC144620594 isoform X2 [Crassostrea virginica]